MLKEYQCINHKDDIGYLIWRILKFWQRGKHKVLDEYGITVSQMEVLGAVYHSQEKGIVEITQILLSQETDIDPMTISTILRNLEKKGLITRMESKTDTRARTVEITPKGSELLMRAMKKVKEDQEYTFRNVNKDVLRDQLTILLDELNRSNLK